MSVVVCNCVCMMCRENAIKFAPYLISAFRVVALDTI